MVWFFGFFDEEELLLDDSTEESIEEDSCNVDCPVDCDDDCGAAQAESSNAERTHNDNECLLINEPP